MTDIEKVEDLIDKQAKISVIHNFGQTPNILFKKPHLKRKLPTLDDSFSFSNHYRFLTKCPASLMDIKECVSDIKFSNGQINAVGKSRLMVPPLNNRYVDWGNADNSMRLYGFDSSRPISVFEDLHIGRVTCALFLENDLITGGDDAVNS